MIVLERERTAQQLLPNIERLFELSAQKIRSLEQSWNSADGAPVFTVDGQYRACGWTDWTQGFQFGSSLLQFDATGDREFFELGRARTLERMAPHLTHTGVHDHGFNNVSTYGNLWRLAREGRFEANEWEIRFYELALKVSGAVQAARWTRVPGGGFIYSFNGAHSLFVDTIRSLRALGLAHLLGHRLMEEQDSSVSLIERLIQHARATAEFSVYYGRGRDTCDVRGRVAHESLFNVTNGSYRGPSSQQGYSPFTTWTRGLAWAILGFAEQLEFIDTLPEADLLEFGRRSEVQRWMLEAARAAADYYLETAAADGIPYWDTGAPGLASLPGWGQRPADPFNDVEPVDSSAAVIAAQGLLRLGRYLEAQAWAHGPTEAKASAHSSTRLPPSPFDSAQGAPSVSRGAGGPQSGGSRYFQAGLLILETLFNPAGPYVSMSPRHQGLLLHSIYHRPAGWDHVPAGAGTPRGESSQWGDYHAREAALYVQRLACDGPYLMFCGDRARATT